MPVLPNGPAHAAEEICAWNRQLRRQQPSHPCRSASVCYIRQLAELLVSLRGHYSVRTDAA